MLEQKFAFSLVVSCSHAAILLWFLLFFQFFGSDLNGFPSPFLVHSRPGFLLESNLNFSLMVLVFPSGILTLIFWLIAALIFSAGYYSAPIFFYFVDFFSLYHFAAFSTFCVKSF